MGHAELGGIAFPCWCLSAADRWQDWHRDSLDFAISKTAAASGMQLSVITGTSARQLEAKLEAIKNAATAGNPYGSGQTAVTYVCLSDEFVNMYNDAAAGAERELSGKFKD